ncbi:MULTISPECIES: methyl-accepting chemotaxis protein [unclassified Sphingobium]|uniref:methyl-accepting chemotaxis protein n=1 Tax=unclassified Sphingobium TaxID=2611147 RepID=UPI002225340A|nr:MULTISPECIES: methyl-accepting chemotaxis protein [unclassified Sphingobium]MCW2351042.1 methyl-accepting chemotaxis protein [Sphingobium sp. B12D2B]MCW2370257.1 methyl-accepting chemotaxis protein [Sphingobium sp. B11D3D]
MAERLQEFDPQATLPGRARQILAYLGDRIDELGDTAMAVYLPCIDLTAVGPAELEATRQGARTFHRTLLSDFAGEEWTEMARTGVMKMLARDVSIRTQIVIINRVVDKVRDILTELVADRDERSELLAAMRFISLVQAEVCCAFYADTIREQDRIERQRQRDKFSELLNTQIDLAAQLGERLREQARESSNATRGMLDKASEVAAAAEQSAIAMREAAHTSSGLIRAIEEARTEVDQAAEVAALASEQAGEAVNVSTALSDHAQSIESILGLIRDIAGQTNLLALNATIEAARAGDAGRGFAVVAQEVKSLASQTAHATDDIAQKIAAIQNATRHTVETNERIRETVLNVQTMGMRIRTAMDAQSQTVTMITAAVDETALAADSMSSNISAIRQDTEIVASEIDELESGFTEVRNLLGALRTRSANFVVSMAPATDAQAEPQPAYPPIRRAV